MLNYTVFLTDPTDRESVIASGLVLSLNVSSDIISAFTTYRVRVSACNSVSCVFSGSSSVTTLETGEWEVV